MQQSLHKNINLNITNIICIRCHFISNHFLCHEYVFIGRFLLTFPSIWICSPNSGGNRKTADYLFKLLHVIFSSTMCGLSRRNGSFETTAPVLVRDEGEI